MYSLAIDTSERDASCALFEQQTLIAESRVESQGTAEALTLLVDGICKDTGISLDKLGRIAISLGPGSFTGVRSGIASAQGLIFSLGCPLVGISSLLSRIAGVASTNRLILSHMLAAGSDRFAAAYRFERDEIEPTVLKVYRVLEPQVVPEEQLKALAEAIQAKHSVEVRSVAVDAVELSVNLATLLCRAAVTFCPVGEPSSCIQVNTKGIGIEPLYLRNVSAKTLAERRAAR